MVALAAFAGVAACATGVAFDDPALSADPGATVPSTNGDGGTNDTAASGGDAGDAGASVAHDSGGGPSPSDAGADHAPVPDAGSDTGGGPVAKPPAPGEVLITEVMYDPSGNEPQDEWVELFNTTAGPRLLSGLTLRDGAQRTHTIGANPLVIGPSQYVVLVRQKSGASAAKLPSAPIVYEYGVADVTAGVLLANGNTGAVALLSGATEISSAPYGGWFNQASPGGQSVQLKKTSAPSTSASGWCLSPNAWAAGADKGTPGAANDCP